MKAAQVIKFAVIGLGGWWLYNNWATITGAAQPESLVPQAPGQAPIAPTAGGIVPAPAPAPAPPAATASTPPPAAPPAPNYSTVMDTATLITKLQAAAGTSGPLNQDQWNYYRNALVPPALTGEQLGLAYPAANGPQSLSAADFVNRLHTVGLAQYRAPRPMRTARLINYRRVAA